MSEGNLPESPLPLNGRGRKWTQREPWDILLIPLALFLFALPPLLFALSSSAHAQDVSRRSAVVIAAEKASPAVVSIIAAQEVARGANPFGGDPLFDDFFRDFFAPFQRRQTEQSLG